MELSIEIEKISKAYNENQVLDNVSFQVEQGDFVSLIGPSGAGKTTLLKILAGIETPDSGVIQFHRPPDKNRPVILVFQDFALFPHMNIVDNVTYGLKTRGIPKKERRERGVKFLSWFGIESKAKEFPAKLSTGQRQRASIARAMIVEPMVLLLDEPFANLDKNLKLETANFIRSTQKKFETTTIMVTHDQEEAFAVSDKVGVLIESVLRQYAAPDCLKKNPSDSLTANFMIQSRMEGI